MKKEEKSMKNIKLKLATILLLSSALMLSACAGVEEDKEKGTASQNSGAETAVEVNPDESLSITHELGEVTLEKTPENIVVFDYGTLDMLQALNVPIAGLPKSNIPAFLEEFDTDEYVNVGSLKEPDFETIYEMKPDLIFISGRAAAAYDELSKIAPTLYLAIDSEDYMGSLEHNSKVIGQIFGKDQEADAKMKSLMDKAKEIEEKATQGDEEALVILTNDGSISAYGRNSPFGIIHNALGFKEVDEEIETSTHGQNISYEYILDKNPKNLFVIDRAQVVGGEVTASKTLENDLVKETMAYKEGNIFYLDPMIWYISSGGFRSTDMMLDEVLKSLD